MAKFRRLNDLTEIEPGMVIHFTPKERAIYVHVSDIHKHFNHNYGYITGRRVRPTNIEEEFGHYQTYNVYNFHFTDSGVFQVIEGKIVEVEKIVETPAIPTAPTPVDTETLREMVKEEVKEEIDRVSGTIRTVEIVYSNPVAPTVTLPDYHHEVLPEVIDVVAAGLNVFLVGPAGTGKSTIADQVSQALGLGFQPLSFGPGTLSSKLFGYMNATGQYVGTPYRQAFEHGELFLGDEIDNGNPGMVAELNQATAGDHCAFADGIVKKHPNFRIVLTGNTYGNGPDRMFVGRNILDKAFLDRFVIIDVPTDETLERNIAMSYVTEETTDKIGTWVSYVQNIRANVIRHRLPVVVSPRASINGAILLSRGMKWERVAEMVLWKGLSEDERRKVSP